VNKDEFPVVGRETVVDDEINPLPEMPESKVKHSDIAFFKLLAFWDDL
jgi:hypothetical protein